MKVCDALKPVKFEDNNVIIKKGDKADKMYIVEDGEVKVFRTVSKNSFKHLTYCREPGFYQPTRREKWESSRDTFNKHLLTTQTDSSGDR